MLKTMRLDEIINSVNAHEEGDGPRTLWWPRAYLRAFAWPLPPPGTWMLQTVAWFTPSVHPDLCFIFTLWTISLWPHLRGKQLPSVPAHLPLVLFFFSVYRYLSWYSYSVCICLCVSVFPLTKAGQVAEDLAGFARLCPRGIRWCLTHRTVSAC